MFQRNDDDGEVSITHTSWGVTRKLFLLSWIEWPHLSDVLQPWPKLTSLPLIINPLFTPSHLFSLFLTNFHLWFSTGIQRAHLTLCTLISDEKLNDIYFKHRWPLVAECCWWWWIAKQCGFRKFQREELYGWVVWYGMVIWVGCAFLLPLTI